MGFNSSLDFGSLLGGVANAFGSVSSARMSADTSAYLSNLQMGFNSEEAKKQRDWQERMSNTAYQRAVNDMRSAGINPMLAVSNGGASTPSATAASAGSLPQPDYSGYSRIGSAFARALKMEFGKQIEKMDAEIDATRANSAADVVLKSAEAQKILKETDSIDPRVRRQNDRYGNGLVGEAMRFVRSLANGLGSDIDASIDTPLKDVSTNSAKGLDGAVKVMNEKARLIQEERKSRVREGRANPRRKGRR